MWSDNDDVAHDEYGEYGEYDEYDENDDYDFGERGYEEDFKTEYGAFERVGIPGAGLAPEVPRSRKERARMSDIDNFITYVNVIALNLTNWNIDLGGEDIQRLIETATYLEVVKHKNPTAYILGYMATNGGKQLTKERLDYVVQRVLPHVEDYSVMPPDIIRYARLWQNL